MTRVPRPLSILSALLLLALCTAPATAQEWNLSPDGSGPVFAHAGPDEASSETYPGQVKAEIFFDEGNDPGKRISFNLFFEVLGERRFQEVEEVCIQNECVPIRDVRDFNDGEEEQIRTPLQIGELERIAQGVAVSIEDDSGEEHVVQVPNNTRLAAEELVDIALELREYEHAKDIPADHEARRLVGRLMDGITYARLTEQSEDYGTYKRFWTDAGARYVTVAEHPYGDAEAVYQLIDTNDQLQDRYSSNSWRSPSNSIYQKVWSIGSDTNLVVHVENEIICFVVREPESQ